MAEVRGRYSAEPAGEFVWELPADTLQMLRLQGMEPTRVVRCRDCACSMDVRGRLACCENTEFARWTEPDGFCSRGIERED